MKVYSISRGRSTNGEFTYSIMATSRDSGPVPSGGLVAAAQPMGVSPQVGDSGQLGEAGNQLEEAGSQ
jgi:hypothetical protein